MPSLLKELLFAKLLQGSDVFKGPVAGAPIQKILRLNRRIDVPGWDDFAERNKAIGAWKRESVEQNRFHHREDGGGRPDAQGKCGEDDDRESE
jgi:hypothetical protein